MWGKDLHQAALLQQRKPRFTVKQLVFVCSFLLGCIHIYMFNIENDLILYVDHANACKKKEKTHKHTHTRIMLKYNDFQMNLFCALYKAIKTKYMQKFFKRLTQT